LTLETAGKFLSEISVVWTGSPDAASALLKEFEDAGARVDRQPIIRFGPPSDVERAQLILSDLNGYSWILFTSAQAVRCVADISAPLANVAAVGPATAEYLRQIGWPVGLVPCRHDAGGLAEELLQLVDKRDKILFVRGDQARRTLPDKIKDAGLSLDEIEVYKAIPVSREQAKGVVQKISEGAKVVIVGSPMGVATLAAAASPLKLGELNPRVVWACLGTTTSEALAKQGINDPVYPGTIEPKVFVRAVAERIAAL
jgi:uroporphyrinogen-III synthase